MEINLQLKTLMVSVLIKSGNLANQELLNYIFINSTQNISISIDVFNDYNSF